MRSLTGLCCALLAALSLGLCLFPPRRAAASNFTVNSFADTPDALLTDGVCADAAGVCTLRAAIQQANADPSGDIIGFVITGTINLTGALPDLTTDVTINGPGASLLTARRNTGGDYRIFRVVSGVTAAINGLTIANGLAPILAGPGGGVSNSGMLSMSNCVVSGNSTAAVTISSPPFIAGDGGIYNEGVMTLTGCAVNNNSTGNEGTSGVSLNAGGAHGGGIYNTATLTVVNGVISHNVTGKGGSRTGINCPIVGDGGHGGGINSASGSTLKLSQSTVVLNRTGDGGSLLPGNSPCHKRGLGGGLSVSGTARLRSNIVSLNQVPPSVTNNNSLVGKDLEGFIESLGYNYGFKINSTDIAGTPGSSNNFNDHLRLDLTTLIPIQGSPAIDAGLARDIDEQTVSADRRGALRPFDFPSVPPQAGGDDSDIGAFERQSTDPVTTVQFGATTSSVGEGCVKTLVTLTRPGPVDLRSEVTYVVNDGTASQRGDFTRATGRVAFGRGVSTRSVPVLISEDAYAEGAEELTVTLTSAADAQIGMPNSLTLRIEDNDATDGTANPIDDNATFVGQHYHDFLNRQADSTGQRFWMRPRDECGGDPGCLDRTRVDVSAAFFLSIELQQTGYFVIRVNKAAFGHQPGTPRYLAFLSDAQEVGRDVVVGDSSWQDRLDTNKHLYLLRFIERPDFVAAHAGQNAEQFVDSLFANVGVTPTQDERNAALIAHGHSNRADALRSVVESGSVYNKLYNPGFVLMQYFAYLRRNPDAAPDNNFDGYNF